MKKSKIKGSWKLLLIALSISNYAYAETEITSPIIIQDEEQYTISEDTKITISDSLKNNSAILVQSGGSLKSTNGTVLEIDMTSGEGDGIRIDSKSGNFSFDLGETHIKSNQNGIYTLSDPTGVHTIQMKLGDHSSIASGATALKIDGNSMIEMRNRYENPRRFLWTYGCFCFCQQWRKDHYW